MRLDLPPAFFLGAYVRLAMLGGVGLFVLGSGAAWTSPLFVPMAGTYGLAQAVVGVALFGVHALWLARLPKTEYEPFLRRAYLTLGALAFLAGSAVFIPLALARAAIGMPATGEAVTATLSVLALAAFGIALTREVSHA